MADQALARIEAARKALQVHTAWQQACVTGPEAPEWVHLRHALAAYDVAKTGLVAFARETGEKLVAGTLHAGHCNADHSGPIGNPGCSCAPGVEIKRLRAEKHTMEAERDCLADILAVEHGRRVPDGWTHTFTSGTWHKGVSRVWRRWARGGDGDWYEYGWEVWSAKMETMEGTARSALEAMIAANNATKESK